MPDSQVRTIMPVKKTILEEPELITLAPRGVLHDIGSPDGSIQLNYESPTGSLYLGDAISWL